MPFLTSTYKLDYFGSPSDHYSSALDKRRSIILENQILSYLNIIGGGVINGLDILKENDNLSFSITEGVAIVPFEYSTIEFVDNVETKKTETHHVAINHDNKTTITLSEDRYKNTIVNVFVSSPDSLRAQGSYSIDILPNISRNLNTDTNSSNAYKTYTIDGVIDNNISPIIFVNSKIISSGYTINGNEVIFDIKRFPTDIVTARLEPKNSILLGTITVGEEAILNINTTEKENIYNKQNNPRVDSALRHHKHYGNSDSASKIILTSSTSLIKAESSNDLNTLYIANILEEKEASGFSEEDWQSYKSHIQEVSGNIVLINNFFSTNSLLGYYFYPNTNQENYVSIINNSGNQLILSDNINHISNISDNCIVAPFFIKVFINGIEEFYGFHLKDINENELTIEFDGSLELDDNVHIKLCYSENLLEVTGNIELDSDITVESFVNSINFSGENFTSGLINNSVIPQLDHIGRTKEVLYPNTTSSWSTETYDGINYRPRVNNTNYIKNVLYIEKFKDSYYVCCNNTIYKVSGERFFDNKNIILDGYPDISKPFLLTLQTYQNDNKTINNLYSVSTNMILKKTETDNNWTEFLNITNDSNPDININLTSISDEVEKIYDLYSDSNGYLFLSTNAGLFLFVPKYKSTKKWYKLHSNACLKTITKDHNSKYSIINILENSNYISYSNSNILFLISLSGNKIKVSNTDGLSVGDSVIISDVGIDPVKLKITEINSSDNILTLSDNISQNYVKNRAIILKDFNEITTNNATCLYKNLNNSIYVASENDLYILDKEDDISDIFNQTPFSISVNYKIKNIKQTFHKSISDCYYLIAENNLINNVFQFKDGIFSGPILNNNYDEYISINDNLNSINNIYYDNKNDELFFLCNDDIYYKKTPYNNNEHIHFKNAFTYIGRPTDVANNVFKTKLSSGKIGINLNGSQLLNYDHHTVYVECDLSNSINGDYIYFTSLGGGERVNKFYRIINIEKVDLTNRDYYRLTIDSFDGIKSNVMDIKYGETFDVIKYMFPLAIINNKPQSINYLNYFNNYSFSYTKQTVSFGIKNSFKSEILLASNFIDFIPLNGDFNVDQEIDVFLNNRKISNISGRWNNIYNKVFFDSNENKNKTLTVLVANNTYFRDLNFKGIEVNINTSNDKTYLVHSNDESSLILDGDFFEEIIQNNTINNIFFNIDSLVSRNTLNESSKGVTLISPITYEDKLTITIKDSYIINNGQYTHTELEDYISENESGLTYNFDSIRQSNLLQIFGSMKEFLSSIPNKSDNIEYIPFQNDNQVIDLINSTIENSILVESHDEDNLDHRIGYNVYGLHYSDYYDGLYALTDYGVYFKKNTSISNPITRWKKVTSLLDTIHVEGNPNINPSSPSGFFIGYDKESKKWTVSWGGFHNIEERTNDLEEVEVISIQVDTINPNCFYVLTKNKGILRTYDSGNTFDVVSNLSAYKDLNIIPKDLKISKNTPNVIYFISENNIYKSVDFGENFNLIKKANNNDQLNIIAINNNDNTFDDIVIGGSFLSTCFSENDLNTDGNLNFNEIYPTPDYSESIYNTISLGSLFDLQINDIAFNPNNRLNIYIATNNGVFYTENINKSNNKISVNRTEVNIIDDVVYTDIIINKLLNTNDVKINNIIIYGTDNNNISAEIISITNNSDALSPETIIKVKGNATHIQNSPDTFLMINSWQNINFGLDELEVTSIEFYNNKIYCGTKNNGIYFWNGDFWKTIDKSLGYVSSLKQYSGKLFISTRSNSITEGGIYYLENDTINSLNIKDDILTFDINANTILAGTKKTIIKSNDNGLTWIDLNIPSSYVLSSDWKNNEYGSSLIGTNGAGVFAGSDFGNEWNQNFNSSILTGELKSLYWKIINIYKSNEDLIIVSDDINKDPNIIYNPKLINNFKKPTKITKNFKFIKDNTIESAAIKNYITDYSLLANLSNLNLKSNLDTISKELGFIYNDVNDNPNNAFESFISINNNSKLNNNYKNLVYEDINGDFGGGIFVSGKDSIQYNGITLNEDLFNKNNISNYTITSLAFENSNNKIYLGTEKYGIAEVDINEFSPIISGGCSYKTSNSVNRIDNHDENITDINNNTINGINLYINIWNSDSSLGVYNASIASSDIVINSISLNSDFVGEYAVSAIMTESINSHISFDDAVKNPIFKNNDTRDDVYDTVKIRSSDSLFDFDILDNFEGYKFYFAPYKFKDINSYNGIISNGKSLNIYNPFIVMESNYISNDEIDISLKSYDIFFESNNNFITIKDSIYNNSETTISLDENIPSYLLLIGSPSLRIQTDIDSGNFYKIKKFISPNKVIVDGDITSDIGSICRINYSITSSFDGNCLDLCYLKSDDVLFINNGLEQYIKNTYYDNDILYYSDIIYASISNIGVFSYNTSDIDPAWNNLNTPTNKVVTKITESNGIIYCLTNEKLYKLNLGSWEEIYSSTNKELLQTVFIDDGNIFITSSEGGLNYYNGSEWEHLNSGITANSCPQWHFTSIDDTLYAYGVNAGVFKRISGSDANEENIFIAMNNGLNSNTVTSLCGDNDLLYAGTLENGIYCYKNNEWSKLKTDIFPSKTIKALDCFQDTVVCIVSEQDYFNFKNHSYADILEKSKTIKNDSIYISIDNGITWSFVNDIPSYFGDNYKYINKCSVLLSGEILIVGSYKNIYKSDDKGVTLNPIYSGPFNDVNFINQTKGKPYEIYIGITDYQSDSFILYSNDFCETVQERRIGSLPNITGLSPHAHNSIISLNKVITSVNASNINSANVISGTFSLENQFKDGFSPINFNDGRKYFYSDFGGLKMSINGRHLTVNSRVDERSRIYKETYINSDQLLELYDPNNIGVFTLYNFSRITISGIDFNDGILFNEDNYGLFVNLHIQINNENIYKICSYEKLDNSTIMLIVSGILSKEYNFEYADIKIGQIKDNTLVPITQIFFSSYKNNFQYGISTSLNNGDFITSIKDSISYRENPTDSANILRSNYFSGGYFDNSNWNIFNNNQIINFDSSTNATSTTISFNPILDNDEYIIKNGSNIENILYTNKNVFVWDSANNQYVITNKKYFSNHIEYEFDTINAIYYRDGVDVAYLIVDDGKLLCAENINSIEWHEKTFSLNKTENTFDILSIKDFKIHPTEKNIALMCVSYDSSNASEMNGLWLTTNNANSWQKVFVEDDIITYCNVEFLKTDNNKILITAIDGNGNNVIYSNTIGSPGNTILSSLIFGETLIMAGANGISILDINEESYFSYYYDDNNIFNSIIEDSSNIYISSNKNYILKLDKQLLENSNNINNSIISHIIVPNVNSINKLHKEDNTIYILNENGISVTEDFIEFNQVEPVRDFNIKDFYTENNIYYCITDNQILKVSNQNIIERINTNNPLVEFNCINGQPSAFISIDYVESLQKHFSRFFLPNIDQEILITKSIESTNFIPDFNEEYSSAIFTTGVVNNFNEETQETTIALNDVVLGSENSLKDKVLIIDYNFNNPITISSSDNQEISINYKLEQNHSNGNLITYNLSIFDNANNNSYVLYRGLPNSEIIDSSILLNQSGNYYVYRIENSSYYMMYSFEFEVTNIREQNIYDGNIYIGMSDGIYNLDKENNLTSLALKINNVSSINIDKNNNLYFSYKDGIVKYNSISGFSNIVKNVDRIYNETFIDSNYIICSTDSGIQVIPNNNTTYNINDEYLINDFISNPGDRNNFIKIYNLQNTTTNIESNLTNNYLYITSNNKLFVSKNNIYKLEEVITTRENITDIISSKNTDIKIILCYSSIYLLNEDSTISNISISTLINTSDYYYNNNFVSYYFDGKNIFISPRKNSTDNNVEFISFKLNDNPIFDFIDDAYNGFISNINGLSGLAANGSSGIVYENIYSIGLNANKTRLFCGGKDQLWYRNYPISTLDNWHYLSINDLLTNKKSTESFYVTEIKNTNNSKLSDGVLLNISHLINDDIFSERKYITPYNSTIKNHTGSILYIDNINDKSFKISGSITKERDPYVVSKSLTNYSINNSKLTDAINDIYYPITNRKIFPINCGQFSILEIGDDNLINHIAFTNNFNYSAGYKTATVSSGYSKIQLDSDVASSTITHYFSDNFKVSNLGITSIFDEEYPNIIYSSIFNSKSSNTDQNTDISLLYKTEDFGKTWFEIALDNSLYKRQINKIIIDPNDNNIIYVACSSKDYTESGVFMSFNGGNNFIDISNNLPNNAISSLYLNEDNTSFSVDIIAGTVGQGLYSKSLYGYKYSYNYGYSYSKNSTNDYFDIFGYSNIYDNWDNNISVFGQSDGVSIESSIVKDIDIFNIDNKIVYAATENNGVIRSFDGGFTWENYSDNLNYNIINNKILISPNSENYIWLGTNNGLFNSDGTNGWTLNNTLNNHNISLIKVNDNFSRYSVNLNYILPDPMCDGIMILRKENSFIKAVPLDNSLYKEFGTLGDSFICYYGTVPSNTNNIVNFTDNTNIEKDTTYYYDFYSIYLDVNNNPNYIKFPPIYSNAIADYTSNSIVIAEFFGTVSQKTYNTLTNKTTLNVIFDKDSVSAFNSSLNEMEIDFFFEENNIIHTSLINKAYLQRIEILGELNNVISGIKFKVKTNIHIDVSGYALNPNILQMTYVSSLKEEVKYKIINNSEKVINVDLEDKIGIDYIPGLSRPKNTLFGIGNSTIFNVESTQIHSSALVPLLYVIADNSLFVSDDNGRTFTEKSFYDENDNPIAINEIYDISFNKQDNISSSNQVSGWLATDTGLYFTSNGFNNFINNKSHVGDKYHYVQVDSYNNKIIYSVNDNDNFIRSTNSGVTFHKMNFGISVNNYDINDIAYFKDSINKFLISTNNEIYLINDSINDTFKINIDYDGKIQSLKTNNLKIGDSANSDANSIKINSTSRANDLNDTLSSVEFELDNSGKYIYFDFKHNNSNAHIKDIYIGEDSSNPMSSSFRLRVPSSFTERSVGYSINELSNNKIVATTNNGAYISNNGINWNKVENFLLPDTIYEINDFENRFLMMTSNGLWENNNPENINNFKLKKSINRKVRSSWKISSGTKEILFTGGEEGVRIKYKNFENIVVTTPANFNPSDGISISWGEDSNGNILAGGLDQNLLDILNRKREFTDFCMKPPTSVDALGFTGTLLVRNEGATQSSFIPQNQVSYEARDRRFVDAIRKPTFDITEFGEIPTDITFGFIDGLVIVDNIRRNMTDAVERNSIPRIGVDTFIEDSPYIDYVSVNKEEDANSKFGAGPNSNGALLKANTTYTYTLFPYYEKPPNFVFEVSESGCSWIRHYTKATINNFTINIPISSFPSASIITCGHAFDMLNYCFGTDDGVFFSDKNEGVQKSNGTDGLVINCILALKNHPNYIYGYGYGYGSYGIGTDFFDVFDIDGLNIGYGIDNHLNGLGNGYELFVKETVLIGTNNGIYASYDGARNFTKVFNSEEFGIKNIFDIIEDGNNILIGTDIGIFRSNV